MRVSKLLPYAVGALAVVGVGLAVVHNQIRQHVHRDIRAMQDALPPGDAFIYKNLSVGLFGNLTFTDLRIKHGLDVAAADRLTLHGIGPQSVSGAGADNLRLAEGLNVVAIRHVTIHALHVPKPFHKMTPADWPQMQIGRISLRDLHGGFIRNQVPGAVLLSELSIDHYGLPHDAMDLRGFALQGGMAGFGGARLGHMVADNPNLASTAGLMMTGNINNLAALHLQRRSGSSDVEDLSIGPVTAPLVAVRHLTMQLRIDPKTNHSHSDMVVTDWESHAPQVLALLTSLGYSDSHVVQADLNVTSDYDPARQQFRLAPFVLNVAGMGAISTTMILDQWPELHDMPSPTALLAVQLQSLALNYQDASLFDHVLGFIARQRGVSASQVRAGLHDNLARLTQSGVPAAVAVAGALDSFLQKPDRLQVTINPPQPVALSILALSLAGQPDGLQALNVTAKAH